MPLSSLSSGLRAIIVRAWDASTLTGLTDGTKLANGATWTDQVSGDVATLSYNQSFSYGAYYRTNAFGTLPGIEFENPYPAIFSPSAAVTGVRAVFALAKCTFASQGNYNQPGGVVPSLYGINRDQTDGLNALGGSDASAVGYEDGIIVGQALCRRSVVHTFGVVAGTAASVSSFGSDGAYSFGGVLGAVFWLNAVPTAAQALELSNYLHSLGGTSPRTRPKVARIYFGDSLTSGGSNQSVNADSEYPGLSARAEATRLGLTLDQITFSNMGHYGDVASGCLTTAQTRGTTTIQALVAAGYTDIQTVVWIGTNDIYGGASAATALATAQQIGPALRTAGATGVAYSTLMARGAGANQTAYDAARATYNTGIVGLVPTYSDRTVRIDLDPQLGPNGSQTNTTYFASDQIHMMAPAISRVETLVQAQGFDLTAPTLNSVTIASNGTTLNFGFSKSITGFNAADYLLSGGASLSNATGSGTSRSVTISPPVDAGQNRTIAYAGTATVDLAGNKLATFSGRVVTDNSSVVPIVNPSAVPDDNGARLHINASGGSGNYGSYSFSGEGIHFSPPGSPNPYAGVSAAGTYTAYATVTDDEGVTSAEGSVTFTVVAVASTIEITPPTLLATVPLVQQFTAEVDDQFGNPISSPTITWTNSGAGAINSADGLYFSNVVGTDSVIATTGIAVATATVISAASSWLYSNATAYALQFGTLNAGVESDTDMTGGIVTTGTLTPLQYMNAAGAMGDAYLNGELSDTNLPSPLPALNAEWTLWLQDVSNHLARWRLQDAREAWIYAYGENAVANDVKMLAVSAKAYADAQIAKLKSGAITLIAADGTKLTARENNSNWYAGASISAVPQCNSLPARWVDCGVV